MARITDRNYFVLGKVLEVKFVTLQVAEEMNYKLRPAKTDTLLKKSCKSPNDEIGTIFHL